MKEEVKDRRGKWMKTNKNEKTQRKEDFPRLPQYTKKSIDDKYLNTILLIP